MQNKLKDLPFPTVSKLHSIFKHNNVAQSDEKETRICFATAQNYFLIC